MDTPAIYLIVIKCDSAEGYHVTFPPTTRPHQVRKIARWLGGAPKLDMDTFELADKQGRATHILLLKDRWTKASANGPSVLVRDLYDASTLESPGSELVQLLKTHIKALGGLKGNTETKLPIAVLSEDEATRLIDDAKGTVPAGSWHERIDPTLIRVVDLTPLRPSTPTGSEDHQGMSMPQILTVGDTAYPANQANGAALELDNGGLRVIAFLNQPHPDEVTAYRSTDKQFGVKTIGSVVFFLFKFGTMPWAAAPFSICKYPDPERRLGDDEVPDGKTIRWALTNILVDSSTGRVVNLGMVTLPPNVSKALHDAMQKQLDDRASFTEQRYESDIAAAQSRYPSDDQMGDAVDVVGKGGA